MTSLIDPATQIGTVALSVANLDRSLDYYQHTIGLALLAHSDNTATLGAGKNALLQLREVRGAPCPASDGAVPLRAAGDDAGAKAAVSRLIEASGLRAIDTGPLQRARELEALGLLHMVVQSTLGTSFSSAIKILA